MKKIGEIVKGKNRIKSLLLFLIVSSVFLNILTLDYSHDWGGDFAGYVGQANALVNDNVEKFIKDSEFRCMFSESKVIGPVAYPWGYPLILYFPIKIFGINFLILKVVTFIFFIASLFIIYFLFKNEISKINSLLLILIFSASPFFFSFKQNVLSDIPSLFFALLSLLLIKVIYYNDVNKLSHKKEFFLLILLGLSIFLSLFIRTNLIILLPLMFIVQVLKYKKTIVNKKYIFHFLLPYLIVGFSYMLTTIVLPISSYSSVLSFGLFKLFPIRAIRNIYFYLYVFSIFWGNCSEFSKLMMRANIYGLDLFAVMHGFFSVFFVVGFLHSAKEKSFFVFFFLISIVLFICFPYLQGLRYVVTLIPFYLLFIFKGILKIKFNKIIGVSSRKILYYVSLLLFLCFFIQNIGSIVVGKTKYANKVDGPFSETSQELFSYLKKNTSQDSIISFFKPRVLYFFTKRKSFEINSVPYFQKVNPNYYVFYKGGDQKMHLFLKNNYKLIFENRCFEVFKIFD